MHYAFVSPAVDESRHLRLIANIMTNNNHMCTCACDLCFFFYQFSLPQGLKNAFVTFFSLPCVRRTKPSFQQSFIFLTILTL